MPSHNAHRFFTVELTGSPQKTVHQVKDAPAKYLKEGHRIIGHPFYNYLLNVRKGDPQALVKFLLDPQLQKHMEMSEKEQAADLGHDLLDLFCKDPFVHIMVEMLAAQGDM